MKQSGESVVATDDGDEDGWNYAYASLYCDLSSSR